MNVQTNKTFEKIQEFLAKQPDIRLGIVFGSLAKGRAGRDSDLDIALLGDRPLGAKRHTRLIETQTENSGR